MGSALAWDGYPAEPVEIVQLFILRRGGRTDFFGPRLGCNDWNVNLSRPFGTWIHAARETQC